MKKFHFFLTLLSSVMLFVPASESLLRDTPLEGFEMRMTESEKKEEEEKKKKVGEKEKQAEEEKKGEKEEKNAKKGKKGEDDREREKEKEKEKEYHSHFDVLFVNYDGTVLYHQLVPVGEDASYHGKTPIRKTRFGRSYRFIGWDKPLGNIQCDMVFTAQYEVVKARK